MQKKIHFCERGAGDLALALALALVLSASTALATGGRRDPSAALRTAWTQQNSGLLPQRTPSHPDRATLSPSHSPQVERPRVGLHRPAWTSRPWASLGGPGRSGRCAGRVADSDSHWKRQFTRAARGPQRPRPCQAKSAGQHALVALTSRSRPMPPTRPDRQTRARCA
eukprot:2555216-Prymnesium_polylepis.1